MMHNDRTWCLTPTESAEDLARKLTEMTWCGCTAFAIGRYLWLNDATSPDGAQEYAVLLHKESDGSFLQIESITSVIAANDVILRKFPRGTIEDNCSTLAARPRYDELVQLRRGATPCPADASW